MYTKQTVAASMSWSLGPATEAATPPPFRIHSQNLGRATGGHRGNNYDAMAEPMIPAESSSSQQNYQRVSYLELPEAKVCVSKTCQLLESFQNWVNQLLRCAHRQKVEFYELYDSGFKLHGVPLPKVHVWPRYRIFKPIRLKKSSHEHQPHLPPSTLATPNDSSRDTGAPSLPGRVHCKWQVTAGKLLTQCRRSRLHQNGGWTNQEWGVGPVGQLKWGFNQPTWIIALVGKPRLSLSHASVFTPAQHDSRQGPKLLTMDLFVYFSDVPIVSIIPRAISCHWNGWDQMVKAHYLQSPCFLVTIFVGSHPYF